MLRKLAFTGVAGAAAATGAATLAYQTEWSASTALRLARFECPPIDAATADLSHLPPLPAAAAAASSSSVQNMSLRFSDRGSAVARLDAALRPSLAAALPPGVFIWLYSSSRSKFIAALSR